MHHPTHFLHTADWQLGLRAHFIPGDAGAIVRNERFQTLHRIGEVARETEAEFVVVAGEAEELLLARLEGRRPGRTGGTRSDMGVWGLLWVAQDETAYADPGDALDDSVRGTLSEAIGRQVGQVLGGKHGERVRPRVLEHAARYFTPKTNAASGDYRAAGEKLKEVDARLKRIGALQPVPGGVHGGSRSGTRDRVPEPEAIAAYAP